MHQSSFVYMYICVLLLKLIIPSFPKEFSEYGEYDDAELVSGMETTEDPEMILDKTELEARRLAQRKFLARQRYIFIL